MRQNYKTIIIIVFIVVILIGVFFILRPKQEERVVKISDRGLASSLPIYVAIEKGFFNEEGVKPELVKLTSGNDVVNALISKDVDVGEIPIDPLIFAESKDSTNAKVFMVGRWDSSSGNKDFDYLLVLNSSKINNLKDLERKKIGVFPGVTAKTFLKYYLSKKGVDTKNIEFVQLTPQTQIPALLAGSIDSLWAYQPTATIALSENAKEIDSSIYNNLGFTYYAVYAFSGDFILDKDISFKTERALLKAAEYMQENEEESRMILGKYTSLGELSSEISYFPNYSSVNSNDVNGIQVLTNFYLDEKLIDNSIDVNRIIF